jgi:tetratricopeptide (TPR) repeat protein
MERAARSYESAIESDARYSFVPYINLSWVMQKEGFGEKALFLLRQADDLFPQTQKIVMEYAKLLNARGEKKAANTVIEEYLKKNPDDFNVRFLKLQLSRDQSSFARSIIELKDFYYENSHSESTARLLVSMLLSNHDIEGARAALAHYGEVGGADKTAWVLATEAFLQAFDGKLDNSYNLFSQALRAADQWEIRYNRAVIGMELGRLKEAQDDLKRSEILIESSRESLHSAYKARIHAQLAGIAASQGNALEAAREIDNALNLDPTNADAFRIKKKLEDAKRKQ